MSAETTWMCDHGHHGDGERAPTNALTFAGRCNGTVRRITDRLGAPVRPCGCTCHLAAVRAYRPRIGGAA